MSTAHDWGHRYYAVYGSERRLPYTFKTTCCPQCRETVTVPANTVYARHTSHGKKLFCSYHCVRAWDKAHQKAEAKDEQEKD